MKNHLLFSFVALFFIHVGFGQTSEPVLSFLGMKNMENIKLSQLHQCEKLILKCETEGWNLESAYVTIWAKDGTMEERQIKAGAESNTLAFTKELCDLATNARNDTKIYFDSVKLRNKSLDKTKTLVFFVMTRE